MSNTNFKTFLKCKISKPVNQLQSSHTKIIPNILHHYKTILVVQCSN